MVSGESLEEIDNDHHRHTDWPVSIKFTDYNDTYTLNAKDFKKLIPEYFI